MSSDGIVSKALPGDLYNILQYLYQHPYPFVPSPPETKKRASVTLILRVRPTYTDWPPLGAYSGAGEPDVLECLENFFEQDWVRAGDPEALFIKRTSRKGDRWGGHVALPGGGRDPEDEDDQATAIRETMEEVGLDLRPQAGNAIPVGSLPQRVVTTSWGKVPFMVLCPYVFLLIRHDIPPLRLQPTEVASIHWVPLRALLSPSQRTYESQDVAARMTQGRNGVVQHIVRVMLGPMRFCAIDLVPSETLHASSVPDTATDASRDLPSNLRYIKTVLSSSGTYKIRSPPLLLWGLTLGVLIDLLYLFPPHDAFDVWTYPTFSPPDVRFVLWLFSYRFRKAKQEKLRSGNDEVRLVIDQHSEGMAALNDWSFRSRQAGSESPKTNLDGNTPTPSNRKNHLGASGVSLMLEGYYDVVRHAVGATMIARCTSIIALAWAIFRKKIR